MNRLFRTFPVFIIFFNCCFSSQSQTDERINQIGNYCDGVDRLKDIQTIRKAGSGVILDFIISNKQIVKIIEHPSGYKNITAKETYYFENQKPVYIYADMEISNEEGDRLTVELQKIYLDDKRITGQFISRRTYDADSLYSKNSDPVKTASDIRKNTRFTPEDTDPGFEKNLLDTIDDYLNAAYKKDGDPFLEKLYSPFI